MLEIICDGIGSRTHSRTPLGGIVDTWATPMPATVGRQLEHAELVRRVLPDAEPAPIIEPVSCGFVPTVRWMKRRPTRSKDDAWRWETGVRRSGAGRFVFDCPTCRAHVVLSEAELRERVRHAGPISLRYLAP